MKLIYATVEQKRTWGGLRVDKLVRVGLISKATGWMWSGAGSVLAAGRQQLQLEIQKESHQDRRLPWKMSQEHFRKVIQNQIMQQVAFYLLCDFTCVVGRNLVITHWSTFQPLFIPKSGVCFKFDQHFEAFWFYCRKYLAIGLKAARKLSASSDPSSLLESFRWYFTGDQLGTYGQTVSRVPCKKQMSCC